jgi:hypothetical protein
LIKSLARVSVVAVLLAVMFTLALTGPVFAAGGSLNFISSTPQSGKTGVPIENVGIKLFFDGNVIGESVWASNSKAFMLKDSEGNKVDYRAYAGTRPGEENYILVIADPVPMAANQPGQLLQNTVYTLTISADLMSVDGATLGQDVSITFETMDVAANSRISMIMMVLMLVAVFALMFLTNWRKMKAEAEAAALIKANPYKIAKEKSITVDEAKELIEKAKERNQKQLEKVGGKAPEPEVRKSAAPRLDNKNKNKDKKKTHKVKGPRPVSEGGSTFKTGRKAEKEKKARAEAARKAQAQQRKTGARSGSKRTGSKNKKRKK